MSGRSSSFHERRTRSYRDRSSLLRESARLHPHLIVRCLVRVARISFGAHPCWRTQAAGWNRASACWPILHDRARHCASIDRRSVYPVGLCHFAIFHIFPLRVFDVRQHGALFVSTLGVLIPISVWSHLSFTPCAELHGDAVAPASGVIAPSTRAGNGAQYLAVLGVAAFARALLSAGVR